MKITKFSGKDCVKCKVLDKVFQFVTLPCDVETRYVEDEGTEAFIQLGVMSLPTLVLENETDKITLTGAITPKQIQEAIEKLS